MVKKLHKHEFLAWLRVIWIVWSIVLLSAGFNRVIQLFENDSTYYNILFVSSLVLYVVALFCCLSFPLIFGVVRFYRNFFTGEGYLTFTLPATQAQLLWVKVSTAVCFGILSGVVCLISGCVAMVGEVLTEVWKAAAYLGRTIITESTAEEIAHLVGWVLELLLALLVAEFVGHLFYYTCICIGQLFRKNRVLAAVGVYFGIYVITQILSTVMMVAFTMMTAAGMLDGVGVWIEENPIAVMHIVLGGYAVLMALMGLVYYLICHHIVRKKLNLE
jgi:hypothetical protein